MQPPKISTMVKPTQDTKFHIDYAWWEKSDEDLRVYLLSHLPADQRDRLAQNGETRTIDHIDPETGEVHQLDEIGMALQNAAKDPHFINPHTSVVDSVFRVFIANNNQPLTPHELGELLKRPAATILKTLSGARVYKGIRPVQS
ncbi:MAG: hypothetical protein SF162_05430 [bacterium]|nr:hypothetical protein [bacterium]